RARRIRSSFRAEQVFQNAGLPWDKPTIEMVFNALGPTGQVRVRRWPDGLYFSITDYGAEYVHTLTRGTLPVAEPDIAGQAPPPRTRPRQPGPDLGIGGF